jgi:hypothetical protein
MVVLIWFLCCKVLVVSIKKRSALRGHDGCFYQTGNLMWCWVLWFLPIDIQVNHFWTYVVEWFNYLVPGEFSLNHLSFDHEGVHLFKVTFICGVVSMDLMFYPFIPSSSDAYFLDRIHVMHPDDRKTEPLECFYLYSLI